MTCYFNDDLKMKAHSREDILDAPAICKPVKKILSAKIMEYTLKRQQQIENEDITVVSHP